MPILNMWNHKALGQGVVVRACNPITQEVEAGDQEFKASLGYIHPKPLVLKNRKNK
jgi:hypothetical protein